MKKNRAITALLAVLLLTATGCSKDDCGCKDGTCCGNCSCCGNNNNQGVIISGDGLTITPTVVGNDGTTPVSAGSTLGYFLTGTDGSSVSTNNMLIIGPDGSLQLSDAALAEGQTYTLYGYSPYNDTWTDALTAAEVFSVSTSQQTAAAYSASDLLRSETRLGGTTTQMTFQHMMVSIVVHVIDQTGNHDLSARTRASGNRVTLHDMQTTVLFNLREGTVTTQPQYVSDIESLIIDSNERRLTATAIVAPQTKTQGEPFVELEIGDTHYNFPMPVTDQMQSGNTYTYRMQLTDNGLIPLGNYVTGWKTDADIELDAEVGASI